MDDLKPHHYLRVISFFIIMPIIVIGLVLHIFPEHNYFITVITLVIVIVVTVLTIRDSINNEEVYFIRNTILRKYFGVT